MSVPFQHYLWYLSREINIKGLIYLQAFALDNVFDRVMKQHNIHLEEPKGLGIWNGLRRIMHPILYDIFLLFLLPLQLIPVVGQFLLAIVISYFGHIHYFDLKGMAFSESTEYIKANRSSYLSFGFGLRISEDY